MSKKCCKRNCKCSDCNKSPQYCGDDLLCINVKEGDNYDDIIKKLNDVICTIDGNYFFENNLECEDGGFVVKNDKGEIVFDSCYPLDSDTTYTFEANTSCSNGGIIVRDSNNVVVFEQCYNCCDCSGLGVNITTVRDDRDPSRTTITTATATGGSGNYSFVWTAAQYEEPDPGAQQITFNYTQTTTTLMVERSKATYTCLWNLRVKDNNTNCFIDRAYLIKPLINQ